MTEGNQQESITEIRAIILLESKRVDLHIIDAWGVVDALRKTKQLQMATEMSDWLLALESLTTKHPDAHKIEITPDNFEDLEHETQAVVDSGDPISRNQR